MFSANCLHTNATAYNCSRAIHSVTCGPLRAASLQKPGCNSATEPQRYRVWTVAHSQPQIKLIKQNNNGRAKQSARMAYGYRIFRPHKYRITMYTIVEALCKNVYCNYRYLKMQHLVT